MIIYHRCAICGHNSLESKARGNGVNCGIILPGQSVCCQRCDWGPSVLAPTYSSETMKIVKEIMPPGTRYYQNIVTCDCDECHALYKNPPRVIL